MFLLEKLIGSGVTSSVYGARELKTGRIFALKILRTRCEETRTASRLGFRRIQPLSHPSLIHIYEMMQIGDYVAFQMELVEGTRLLDVIRNTPEDNRAKLFEIVTRLLRDIGGALRTIQASGSVHRDVKPENVMLDTKGRFRLIDYGLVGSYDPVSDPDARRNHLAGTYWYMAPESITTQIYPPACDVYAFGCIVLELIADRSKLPEETAGVSLFLIRHVVSKPMLLCKRLTRRPMRSSLWRSPAVSPANHAIEAFQMSGESCRFDKAHAQVPLLWSYLWLGRIADMKQSAATLLSDANDRNHEYLRRMTFVGLGAAVPLIDDKAGESRSLHRALTQQFACRRPGWWMVVDSFSPLMRYLYEGRSRHALRYLKKITNEDPVVTFKQRQLFRVLCSSIPSSATIRSVACWIFVTKWIPNEFHLQRRCHSSCVPRPMKLLVTRIAA